MKTKRPYSQVIKEALAIVAQLRPACERIEIAGSLRRKSLEVGDIEIVAIPILSRDLFGAPAGKSAVDFVLGELPIKLIKNGPKFKQFIITAASGSDYQVDLFLQPDPATWGVNFMIRTGSAEFGLKMVTPKRLGGFMPDHLRVSGARVWRYTVNGSDCLYTPEERDVFALWGMEFIEPENRNL